MLLVKEKLLLKKSTRTSDFVDLQNEFGLSPFSKRGMDKAKELAAINPNLKFVCDASGCAEIANRAAAGDGYNYPRTAAWDYGNQNKVVYSNPNYDIKNKSKNEPLHNPTEYNIPNEVKSAKKGQMVGMNRKNNVVDNAGKKLTTRKGVNPKVYMADNKNQANDSYDYANEQLYPNSRGYEHVGYVTEDGKLLHGTGPGKNHKAYYNISDLNKGPVNLGEYGAYEPVEVMQRKGYYDKLKDLIGYKSGGKYKRNINNKYEYGGVIGDESFLGRTSNVGLFKGIDTIKKKKNKLAVSTLQPKWALADGAMPSYHNSGLQVRSKMGGKVKKYQTGGEENKKIDEDSTNFHQQWMGSPMYDKMLRNSANKSDEITRGGQLAFGDQPFIPPKKYKGEELYNYMKDSRNNQLKSGNTSFPIGEDNMANDYLQLSGLRGFAPSNLNGYYDGRTNNILIRGDKDYTTKMNTAIEQKSKRVDRGGSYIPGSDQSLIYNSGLNKSLPNDVNASDIRAKLNMMRQTMHKDMGVDIFNQPVTEKQLQQYLKKGYNTHGLDQHYSKDKVLEMLNNISYNNSTSQNQYAKTGGIIKKRQNTNGQWSIGLKKKVYMTGGKLFDSGGDMNFNALKEQRKKLGPNVTYSMTNVFGKDKQENGWIFGSNSEPKPETTLPKINNVMKVETKPGQLITQMPPLKSLEANTNNYLADVNSFKEQVAHIESRGNYNAMNKDTKATGKYQFIPRYHKEEVARLFGVDWNTFYTKPELQERYMDYWTEKTLRPTAQKLLAQYPNAGYNINQLMGMVHFQGEGGARSQLKQGTTNTKVGYNAITTDQYVKRIK